MQEFFYTILAIWVVTRLFNAFSSNKASSQNYQQTNNNFYSQQQQQRKTEGEIHIKETKSPDSKIPPHEGEYVDYEEVK